MQVTTHHVIRSRAAARLETIAAIKGWQPTGHGVLAAPLVAAVLPSLPSALLLLLPLPRSATTCT